MKTTVLFVIDNRMLIKKIEKYFNDEEKYEVKITLYSRNAFKFFIDFKPQLIILDTDITQNYKNLLGNFEQCQWNYNIILLNNECSAEEFANIHPNMYSVAKDHLLEKNFAEALLQIENAEKTKVYPTETKLISYFDEKFNNELVSCIYAVNTDNLYEAIHTNTLQELKTVMELYVAHCDIHVNGREVLIMMHGIRASHGSSMKYLGDYIFKYLSMHYAVFTMEDIWYSDLTKEDLKQKMEQAIMLSYFCSGEVVNFNAVQINACTKNEFDLIDGYIARILKNIFAKDYQFAIRELRLLYEHLKRSRSDLIKKYVHFMLENMFFILNEILKLGQSIVEYNCKSCEEEVFMVENDIARYCDLVHAADTNIIVNRCITFMLEHLSEDISLASAAEELKISKNYISKMFNINLNTTFLDYLKMIKMKKAKFLLMESEYKTFEIAELLGYNDRHYFSRDFKKNTRKSPEAYRKKAEERTSDEDSLER